MREPLIVFYVSGHGFGHAIRQIQVMRALRARQPDLALAVRTSAPARLFEMALGSSVRVDYVETDTGVAQIDSLTVDVDRSIAESWTFHRDLSARAEQEAAVLRALRPTLVVGDIPPLAFEAAHRAGVPSAAIFNFTWDWIYDAYEEQREAAPKLVPTLRDAYRHASVAWRVPLSCGPGPFTRVLDVPLIARRSSRDPDDARRLLQWPADRTLVLLSFGQYGLGAVDWSLVGRADRYRFIVTPGPGSRSSAWPAADPASSILVIEEDELSRMGLHYEDLVAAVDVVVSKPGYGIIAECAANDTALLYTSRGRFAEYDELVTAMPRFLRCGFIDHDDLFAGRWLASLDRLMALPKPPRADVSGADVVAGQMLDICGRTS
jgi:hypothetical protein